MKYQTKNLNRITNIIARNKYIFCIFGKGTATWDAHKNR